ncbi:MAG: glycosyltransferase [Anaerolineales bacterium]|nr:glycosyltransferase [Anaerolineales bacterium]
MTKKSGEQPKKWIVADLHTRRKITQLTARSIINPASGTTVQVDVGGLWIRLADNGNLLTDEGGEEFEVDLSSALSIINIPPTNVQGIKLQHASSELDILSVRLSSYPTNLSLSLGQGVPFWVRPGELVVAETSPEFAEVLQAFLAEAEVVNGYYDVPLVLHSDSIASLDVTVEIDYLLEKSLLPAGVSETKLPFKHNGLAETEGTLLQIEVPVGSRVVPCKTNGRITGAFEPSRVVYGPLGEVTPVAGVPIQTNQSQAQPVQLYEDLLVTAVDLLLSAVTTTAEVDVLLLADTDGKPSSTPQFSPPATISISRDVTGKPTWISTPLPSEIQFETGKRLWLVLQTRRGEVRWHVQPNSEGVGLQFTDNGGLSWRQTAVAAAPGPLAGFFRLRHTPSRFQMPVELQVGTGDAAQRISLERFAPTGRVDFNLDFADVAAKINSYLEANSHAAFPEGEHLVNGDFKEWTPVGESPGAFLPISLPDQPAPTAIAIDHDGQKAYIGTEDGQFILMELPCNTVINTLELNVYEGQIQLIIISPDSSRAYIVSNSDRLHVVDIVNEQTLGEYAILRPTPHDLVIAPDGRHLYVTEFDENARQGAVRIINTALLEEDLLTNSTPIQIAKKDDELSTIQIESNLDLPLRPTSLAVDSNNRLFVTVQPVELTEEDDEDSSSTQPDFLFATLLAEVDPVDSKGYIHVFNLTTHKEEVVSPLQIGSRPRGIALSPDGKWAVVANAEENSISIIDTIALSLVGSPISLPGSSSISATDFPLASIAIAPNGQRVYTAIGRNQTINIVSIPSKRIVERINLNEAIEDAKFVLSPQGDRLYSIFNSLGDRRNSLGYLIIGLQVPEEWVLTSGSLLPFCYSDPFHQVGVLGVSPFTLNTLQEATSLSQVIPIAPDCNYRFSFWGTSLEGDAFAEVLWFGSECGSNRIDQVPIRRFEPQVKETESNPHRLKPQATEAEHFLPEIVLHEAQFTPPVGATQAEIRFTAAERSVAIVDEVSFQATKEAIVNGDFNFRPAGEVASWTLSPTGATGLALSNQDGNLSLGNSSISSFALVQTIPVSPEQSFNLSFQGRVTSPTDQPPRLELHWFAIDDAAAGPTVILEIDPTGPDKQVLRSAVPATAVEAELHLVLPPGTALTVNQISFVPIELITVPMNFLAHAPGELTVTNLRVCLDALPASRPPIPETGLCTPTPPGREPGSRSGDQCYCPCCGGEKHLNDPQPTKTSAGRPATKGKCSDCGAVLTQPGGRATRGRTVTRAISARPAVRRVATTVERVSLPEVARVAAAPPPILPVEEELAAILPMMPTEWASLAGLSVEEIATPPLTAISGIGPARAENLEQLGFGSMAKLAEADLEAVANGLRGVSQEMASHLISTAKEQMMSATARQAPLVSCIMPTFNRPRFAHQAIQYFLRQDYPNRELIIIDDGTESIEALVPEDERIHYHRLDDRLTIGTKMNIGGDRSGGDILVRWEDDVWMAPWRLSYQAAALLKHEADFCGPEHYLHYDVLKQAAWHSVRPSGTQPWILGSTLCFSRAYWERNPFPDINLGDEIRFVRSDPAAKNFRLQAVNFLVDIIHGQNTAPKNSASERWHAFPVAEIKALIGDDWSFYEALAQP